jgi:hypothetical protein
MAQVTDLHLALGQILHGQDERIQTMLTQLRQIARLAIKQEKTA